MSINKTNLLISTYLEKMQKEILEKYGIEMDIEVVAKHINDNIKEINKSQAKVDFEDESTASCLMNRD